jgi:hypothetical protein
MKEIIFYNDLIQDLINLKKISSMDAFYDKVEELLKEGNKIVFILSSFEPETQHRTIFSSLDIFLKWRKNKEIEKNRLIDLFTPKN